MFNNLKKKKSFRFEGFRLVNIYLNLKYLILRTFNFQTLY